jgi:polyphosphate kinase
MLESNLQFIDKELSWLSFNERVLQEAASKDIPVIQRLQFLGIFSNNMDEFYRVRVADVSRLAAFAAKTANQERYSELLEKIQERTRLLQKQFDRVLLDVLKALNKQHIYLINESQLDKEQASYVEQYFDRAVLPELDPVLLEAGKPFPRVTDGYIYLAAKIFTVDKQVRYAVIDIPTERLPRFIEIPHKKGSKGKVFIVLDNIIRHCLAKTFRGVIEIKEAVAYTFKITLDAELEVDVGVNQSLVKKMVMSLKKRQKADPERLVYDGDMPEDLFEFLTKGLKLTKYDSVMAGSRYHNAKDFMNFPAVGKPNLQVKKLPVLPVPELTNAGNNIFSAIRKKDILLHYPYQSFNTVIDLLKTAAIDPAVKSIHISLYRVAKNSRVVDALLNARRNYKDVTVVVELQARFDEAANIDWATQLTEGGVNVIYGVPGLKVHAKLILIAREENQVLKYYTHIGTGNFNEKTSAVYTDFSLLTYNQEMGDDVVKVFDFIAFNYKRHDYRHILVSPHSARDGIERLIKNEISNAQNGHPAAITIKCNNLVDTNIIQLLYEGSDAGVRIRIICRGMCSLIPGIENVSDNIEVISIVDNFLEHARVYAFYNDGKPKYFISSADLMARNLDSRVEVTTPIYDAKIQKRLQDILDIQWCDNVKARVIDLQQSNTMRQYKSKAKVRSQMVIHQYLEHGRLPIAVDRLQKRWKKQLEQKHS